MVFVVSWNVAGWTTTAAAIRASFGSLHAYLERLGADVLCIQEAKVGKKRLDQDAVGSGAADRPGFPVPGWESFWAHCADRQMNGVTTFARAGLTHRVDAAPLGEDALDREGRCIVTYHSHASIFNVYVPNSRGGERHAFKHRFLQALQRAMQRVRQETNGRPVILAGDLNLTYRVEDCCYSNRKLCVSAMARALRDMAKATQCRTAATTTADAAEVAQPRFSKRQPLTRAEEESLVAVAGYALLHLQAKAEGSIPPGNSQRAADPCAGVAASPPYDAVALCTIADALMALRPMRRASAAVGDERGDAVDDDCPTPAAATALSQTANRRATVARAENFPTLQEDAMLLGAAGADGDVVDHIWAESLIRGAPSAVTQRNAHIFTASECVGLPCHSRDDAAFALSLLHDDMMVDTLLAAHGVDTPGDAAAAMLPGAARCSWKPRTASEPLAADATAGPAERLSAGSHDDEATSWQPVGTAATMLRPPHLPATCWDQYRNKRYENDGNRIDYLFADAVLAPRIVRQSCNAQQDPAARPSLSIVVTDGAVVGPTDESVRPESVRPEGSPASSVDRSSCGWSQWMAAEHLSGFCGRDKAASLRRVTAGGRYAAAPTTGTGLEPLRDADKLLHFNGLPSTGLFVTPPQFSDHIGVCLLLDMEWQPRPPGVSVDDPGRTLYRRTSANLRDMFAARTTQQQQVTRDRRSGAPPDLVSDEAAASVNKRPRCETPEVLIID